MMAPLLIGLGVACLLGALTLTFAGVRCLLVRTQKAAPHAVLSTTAPEIATVHLEGTGALSVESGVLLNTLWEHLPNAECQSGECGGCKVRLLEGRVRWIRDPVVEINRQTHILACSCEALGPIRCAAI
jgi:ferredoxin